MFFMLTLGSTKKSCCTKNCCVNKKIFQIEVSVSQQNYVSHKKYVVATKKIMRHPKEDSGWLNVFSVAQKRNPCLQKWVPIAYKSMLNWLKFCVAEKYFDVVQKLKMVSINVIKFIRTARYTTYFIWHNIQLNSFQHSL